MTLKKDELKNYAEDTAILYAGQEYPAGELDPEAAPLFLTSAFILNGGLDDVTNSYNAKKFTYIRTRNPNRRLLEDAISQLEHAETSTIFASGMGAIHTTLMHFLRPGNHIVAHDTLYGESIELMHHYEEFDISTTFVNFGDGEALAKAIIPGKTKVLFCETSSNPLITLVDIEAAAKIAHEAGVVLIVDNTFMTPAAIKCLDLGADIVINSLTKFVNGHSDALLGSASGKKEHIEAIDHLQMIYGATGGTFNSWLVLRGIRTFDVRMERQMSNADKLARALAENPHVLKVNYPTVPNYPQKELAKKLFGDRGCGAMMSIELPAGHRKEMNEFMKSLKLARYAPTLGGFRTTLSHPATSSHQELTEEERLAIGITDGLMRVSVGLENAEDLIKDFNEAINKAYKDVK